MRKLDGHMIADDTIWAMRRKVAPPPWLIATPALIAPPAQRALPAPMTGPASTQRDLDTDWLPSRSFGGCTGWA